jgi:hypothetical protein
MKIGRKTSKEWVFIGVLARRGAAASPVVPESQRCPLSSRRNEDEEDDKEEVYV